MATVPPRTERRRARPGSVLRPVNGRLYRGTWMLVGLPLLVTAFSVARPTPLPRAFLPAFDGNATRQLASDLVTSNDPNLFLSTDGGAFGGLGAAWFAAHSPGRHDVAAVINLDAVGGTGPVRLQFNGDTPRTPSGTFLETIAARVAAQIGHRPGRPSALAQLVDLGFPFSLYEQAPFLAKGIAAVTITTAGDKPPNPLTDTLDGLSASRLGEVGRAAQDAIGTLDEGLEFAQGTSSYVYVGSRLVRGWAVELVLIACLLPFMATAIDLFARCRRRRIPLGPALRAYRSRLGFWI